MSSSGGMNPVPFFFTKRCGAACPGRLSPPATKERKMMTPRVTQVCYTSRDIEATALSITSIDRIGPFFFAEFPQQNLVYRNRRLGNGRVKVAFAYKDDLQYEL